MSPEPQSQRLPFEPGKNRKKPPKNQPAATEGAEQNRKQPPVSVEERVIPEVVSKRMIRRMALLCGLPTTLGIATFIASYVVVTNEWFELPNIAVVLVSMGFFGLGVLGLSYGVISASWDEETPGSVLGFREFATNFGRMRQAWRSAGKQEK